MVSRMFQMVSYSVSKVSDAVMKMSNSSRKVSDGVMNASNGLKEGVILRQEGGRWDHEGVTKQFLFSL